MFDYVEAGKWLERLYLEYGWNSDEPVSGADVVDSLSMILEILTSEDGK